MAFGPWAFGATALTGGLELFGGTQASNAAAQMAAAQIQAAREQGELNRQMSRDLTKFGEASNIRGDVFDINVRQPTMLGFQKEAAMFEAGPLAERLLAGETERARRGFGLQSSEEARRLKQSENRAELARSLAEREATMAGMFGRIAPREVGTMFV